jgi:3-(3-hydroxy-phenyl)propionate hydroxylase
MRKKHDRIIIAGGGPVGSIAALTLAQAGIPVTVLEREPEIVIDYRASTFHPPTLDLLEPCGATEALVSMGLIAPTMQYRDRQRGKIAEFDFSLLRNDTRHPYRLQCEQFKLVGWAYRQLAAIPGAELLFRHEVIDLSLGEDEVSLRVASPAGDKTYKGDFLIAADGGRSTVRKALGIDFEGFTYPEHFLVAGTRFDFKSAMPGICSVNYTADPVEWYLLLEIPDMWRIVTPVDPDREPDDAVQESSIQSNLQNLLPRAQPYEIVVKAIYRVSQRVAELLHLASELRPVTGLQSRNRAIVVLGGRADLAGRSRLRPLPWSGGGALRGQADRGHSRERPRLWPDFRVRHGHRDGRRHSPAEPAAEAARGARAC